MIRLGLRLAVTGGWVSALRAAFTVVGVAIGVALLLLIVAAQGAVQGRADRSAWQNANAGYGATAPDGAWFLAVSDYYRAADGGPTAMITRVYVAALGANPPVPPGLSRLPGPGEVAVSPAMSRLLAEAPDDELDDRYPGRVTMTIGEAGLAHVDELIAIVGLTAAELEHVRSARVVHGFRSPVAELVLFSPLRVVLVVGAVLLLVPIAVFIVMATRIAAAQREQRLAAIRLVGANRRQVAGVAAVDTSLAVVAGIALGVAAYESGRRALVATVSLQGGPFYAEDAIAGPGAMAVVAAGVVLLTAGVTQASLTRVQFSPLGIVRRSRRTALRPTQVGRVLPLGIGLAGVLGGHGLMGLSYDRGALFALPLLLTIGSFLLTAIGLVVAGPWLCALIGAAMIRLSRRASGVIAGHRIAADPSATFRAVGGVAIASFALTYIAGLTSPTTPTQPGREGTGGYRPGVVEVSVGEVPTEAVAPLLSSDTVVERRYVDDNGGYHAVVACTDLARVMVITCPYDPESDAFIEPSGRIDDLLVTDVYIPTEGSRAAKERARTVAARTVPNAIVNVETDPLSDDVGFDLLPLVQAGGLVVLIVAACSLAAATVGGLIERRRSFALLRATGVPLSRLRTAVLLETAVPMVVTSLIGAGLGLLTAQALIGGRDGIWRWPDTATLAVIGAAIVAAFALSAVVLPLVNAATRHDAVRYE